MDTVNEANKCHGIITFFLVSVSVSVPVDLEDTGLSVPSTLSSRSIFKGLGGIADILVDGGACLFSAIIELMLVLFCSVEVKLEIKIERRVMNHFHLVNYEGLY